MPILSHLLPFTYQIDHQINRPQIKVLKFEKKLSGVLKHRGTVAKTDFQLLVCLILTMKLFLSPKTKNLLDF